MAKLIIRTKKGFKEALFTEGDFREKKNAKVIAFKKLQLIDIMTLQNRCHWSFSIEEMIPSALDFADKYGYDYAFMENTNIRIQNLKSDDYFIYLVKYYLKK